MRYGFKQWLEPARGRASLGAEVVLRRLDGTVLVDWPASVARMDSGSPAYAPSVDGWKPRKGPPPPGMTGVTDAQLARRRELPER